MYSAAKTVVAFILCCFLQIIYLYDISYVYGEV